MPIIQFLAGSLIGVGMMVFLLLFLSLIVLGVVGLVTKNFASFKKVGKWLLYDIAFIFASVVIWGLLSVIIGK